MDVADIKRLFDGVDDTHVDVWPDLRLLSNLLLLSSEACVSGDFAVHWHQLDEVESREFVRTSAPPKIPGFLCSSQGQGRTNPFCWLMWDGGRDASACRCDKLKAEKTTMRTRQPYVYECHAGLTDIAVPVCAGGTYLGTIFTGQVHREPPAARRFERVRKRLRHLSYLDPNRLYEAYMSTPAISEDDLRCTVETLMIIADHAARVWTKTERLLEQERRFERMRTYERKELVEELVNSRSLDPVRTASRLREFGLEHFPTTALVIRIDDLETAVCDKTQRQREIQFDRAVNNLQDVIERMPDTIGAALTFGEITILARPAQTRNPEAGKLLLREVGERAIEMLRKGTGLTAAVGIGRTHDSLSGLHESYQEALEALVRRHSGSTQRVFHIDDLRSADGGTNGAFWRLQEALCSALKRDDSREAADTVRRMAGWLRTSGHAAPAEQQPFMTSAAESLIAAALDAGSNRGRILAQKSRWFEEVLLAKSPDELRQWLDSVVKDLFKEVRAVRTGRVSKFMVEAIAYMEHNRAARLTLEDVAAHVGLSPSYFRHQFGEAQGVSFRDYQMQVRMREASRLLLDPALSVADVAARLGYDNASHFARAFRKYIGVNPREYRANPRL